MSYPGADWEAGHDPAPPAWKASTLPAYATPSCLWSGRHDSNVHEPSDSTALEAAPRLPFRHARMVLTCGAVGAILFAQLLAIR